MPTSTRGARVSLPALALAAAVCLTAVGGCSSESGTSDPRTPSASGQVSTGTGGTPGPPPPTVTLAAVGDMNKDGNTSPTSATGEVASSILAAKPELVFGLGDYQYPKGTCTALVEQYDTLWGKVVPLMFHIAGPEPRLGRPG